MKKKSLQIVLQALNRLAELPGRNAKEAVIRTTMNNPDVNDLFKRVVVYACDSFMKYKTTSVPYFEGSRVADLELAFSFLERLASQRGTTDAEIKELGMLSSVDKETNEVFNRIVTKDLRVGLGVKTWKKFITTLPLHEVMLCDDNMDRFIKEIDGQFDNITTSIKLDGARNWAVVHPNYVVHLSRNGKEYPNCGKFDRSLLVAARQLVEDHGFSWPVKFDGEINPKAEYGRDFDKVMTQLRRLKDVDPSVFEFAVFDVVDPDQRFTLRERYEILSEVLNINVGDDGDVYLLEHLFDYGYTCEQDIYDHLEIVIEAGHEGLVLKKTDGVYELRRSKGWLKVKKFYTVDLAVIGWEYGKKKNAEKLGVLVCSRTFMKPGMINPITVKVNVGSGYDDMERDLYMTETPEVIEVKYQDVTKDGSLRFPVFVKVRDDLDPEEVKAVIFT